ncbi:UNVERIFIED_CONTAM: hypothetical protein RMT77_004928 [Armadillidium vulgare]
MSKTVYVRNLGCMKYKEAWELQKSLSKEIYNNVVAKKIPNHRLLIVEHFPVYTTGIRAEDYDKKYEEKLKALGAEFYRTNRGGLITFHGPGQLTLYPLLHLKSFGKGIRWYVSALERTIIKCLHRFSINSQTSQDTGIWIGNDKICAIGIQGRHVTTHGLSLNCNNDLTWFNHITPCGLEGKGVTSVSTVLDRNVSVQEVLPALLKSFSEVFDADLLNESEL